MKTESQGNQETVKQVRELTAAEQKRIKEFNLHPCVEQIVWQKWMEEPYRKPSGMLMTVGAPLLYWICVMAVGGAAFVDSPILTALSNVAVFLTWVASVMALLIFGALTLVLLADERQVWGSSYMNIWYQKTGWIAKLKSLKAPLAVICFVLSGHLITAVFLLVTVLVVRFFISVIRDKVDAAIEAVKSNPNHYAPTIDMQPI